MSRVIRFRGWHTKLERMISTEELVEDQMTLLADGRFINVHSTKTWMSEILPADKFIPIQFTGLVDENGADVYESDIIEWTAYPIHETDSVQVRGVVEWNISAWFIKHYNSRLTAINSFKVIGNIYENPELLTS